MKDPQEMIQEIIGKTFETLRQCYDNQENSKGFEKKGNSRLVFPMYGKHRNYETRISEQELRFVFVEEFNKYCDENSLAWFYSVETPTMDKYVFKGPKTPRIDSNGQSASFDLVIYNSQRKRIALIEFKALNPNKKCFKKDFLKLNNDAEGDVLRYFVMVLKNHDDETIKSINEKITPKEKVSFHCYSLEKGIHITADILKGVSAPASKAM